jgi:DNA topoisomerase-1
LIITEKPDAASRIASALDSDGKAQKILANGVPYYAARGNREIIVVSALGHLYTVTSQKKGRDHYPVFDIEWVPRHLAERNAGHIQKWLKTISNLAKNADEFIDACDYDVEGSIIGFCILKYACEDKENTAKRMKYSTLTKEEIGKSYRELLPHLDFGLIEAGLTRHEVDWLYGVNVSRALTTAAKKTSGRYVTLSTGRVQGPTLKFLAAREETIRCFVPEPFWTVKARVKIGNVVFEIMHEKRIIKVKEEARAIVNDCKAKNGVVEKVETSDFQELPPFPFDLGCLQREAYSLFGYTPMRTSNIAQRIYLEALISYPRTSSQKLPPSIGYKMILKSLSNMTEYNKLAEELLAKSSLRPNEGKQEDSAHPAIYPTGNLPEKTLGVAERKIWDLIVRRFMATFGEAALRRSLKAQITLNGQRFDAGGTQTLEEGWLRFYKPIVQLKEALLPVMIEGQIVNLVKVVQQSKFTNPPPRYNPGSLLRRMEREGIGTKATRAWIIQTLYDRKYIRDEKIAVTDLGLEVVNVLRKYCPAVVSLELTRKLEQRMDGIRKGQETKEHTLNGAIEILKLVTVKLKEEENKIGEQLSRAIEESRMEERTVGRCPNCQTGKLVILYSKETGKRFVGCTNYFKGICKTTFPLPQKGLVKPLDRACKNCGSPTVSVIMRGRRVWKLCLDPACPSKKEVKSGELQSLR